MIRSREPVDESTGSRITISDRMSHSLVMVWVHFVIRTRKGVLVIHGEVERILYDHLRSYIEGDLRCHLIAMNGMPNHVHILVGMHAALSVQEFAHRVKGESSHWLNQQRMLDVPFRWQTGYGAFSVGKEEVGIVKRYIENQKRHHGTGGGKESTP